MQLQHKVFPQESRPISANTTWLGRNTRGATLEHDWDKTGRAFTGPEDLSGENHCFIRYAIINQINNQLKLGGKQSFVDDSYLMCLYLHLNFSWFHITHLLYISNSFKQNMMGNLPSLSPFPWPLLDGFHPDCENLNLILKTGRNSSSICGWVVWGERPNLTMTNAEDRGSF